MAYKPRILEEVDGGTGQSSYATGDILYASASNTLSKLAAGSDGEVLTLASGAPSWASGAGGGDYVLISTATPASSATVEFTNLTTTYAKYVLEILQLQVSTGSNAIRIRTSTDGGSSYDTGSNDYGYVTVSHDVSVTNTRVFQAINSSSIFLNSTSASTSGLQARGTLGNSAMNMTVVIYNPAFSSAVSGLESSTNFVWQGTTINGNAYNNIVTGSGRRRANSNVDAIQILPNSGNMNGTIKLYGVLA